MSSPTSARWAAAMSLLRWVERRAGCPSTWSRRSFRVDGPHAVQAHLGPDDLPRPLSSMARHVPADAETLRVRCTSDVVRLGKYDIDDVVRFRSFHVDVAAAASSLRVQGAATGVGDPGVERDLRARLQVAEHWPRLAPPLLEHGVHRRRGVAYLREGLVRGRHPRDLDDVQGLVPSLVTGLRRLYEGVGVEPRRLSDVVSEKLVARWKAVSRSALVQPAAASAVRALIERDALVEVSLGHGDLVRTNLLITDDDVVLLDWEYARPMPIAFDLAKTVASTRDPDAAIAVIGAHLTGIVAGSADSYRLEEQLALALAQLLSWTNAKAVRAAAASRTTTFERTVAARARLLEHLVG